MEVQEHATPIIGHKGHSAHRLVLKTEKLIGYLYLAKTANLSAVITLKNIWAQRQNSINKLKEILSHFRLFELKTIAYSGTPDLLVYNTSGNFCTVELKVCKGNKLRFSTTPNCVPYLVIQSEYFYHGKGPRSFAP